MATANYKTFNEYLEIIRKLGKNHWREVQIAKDLLNSPLPDYNANPSEKIATVSPNICPDNLRQCDVNTIRHPVKECTQSQKTNPTRNRSYKRRMRKNSRDRPKHVTNTLTTLKGAKCMTSTDTETDIETLAHIKKALQESDGEDVLAQHHDINLENILCDNENENDKTKTMKEHKHIGNLRPSVVLKASLARRRGDNRQHRKQSQQQQPINQQINIGDAVIYNPDDKETVSVSFLPRGRALAADVHGDTSTAQDMGILNTNDVLRSNNNNYNDTSNVNNALFDSNDLMKWQRESSALVHEVKWTFNRNLYVFGGIDPYFEHCPQHAHHHQQLKLNPSVNGTPLSSTQSRCENIGDQVLVCETVDAMEWRQLSYLPFGTRHHHSVAVCIGLIYLIGGTRTKLGCANKRVFEKSVWCFNPQNFKWTMDSSLPESRRDFAVVCVDKKTCGRCHGVKHRLDHESGFYVIGGEGTNGNALNTVWFYSVRRRMWMKKPPLKIARYGLTAAMVNNEIWVAGGIINDHDAAGLTDLSYSSAATFAEASNKFHTIRCSTGHVITDTIEIYTLKCPDEILTYNSEEGSNTERSLVCSDGSAEGDSGDGDGSLPRARKNAARTECNCTIGQWITSKHHLRVPRVFGKFCTMANGDLFLVGGMGCNDHGNLTSLSEIDYFHVKRKQWRHCGDLNWARHGHDVGLLNDHSFAVIGGVSTVEESTLCHVEVFCTETRKCLDHTLPDLPWPVSGSAVASLLK